MNTLSDARGFFAFDSNFYKCNENLIDHYFKIAGFKPDEGLLKPGLKVFFNQKDGTFIFGALGDGTIKNILSWILSPADKSDREANDCFFELLRRMRKQHTSVYFCYTDYNPGRNRYATYNGHTLLKPNQELGAKGNNYFDIAEINVEKIKYNADKFVYMFAQFN